MCPTANSEENCHEIPGSKEFMEISEYPLGF
jgi:hypothetical protein